MRDAEGVVPYIIFLLNSGDIYMALTNEEKLKKFEDETMSDALKICDEIKEKTKLDFQEKLNAGDKQILSEIYDFMQNSIGEIRKEKSLEISHAGIEYWHEYLKYSDTIFAGILEKVREKLNKFLLSDEYFDYLKNSCINVINKIGAQIDILYMKRDENIILKLKAQLPNDAGAAINFIADEEIKIGGLRFRDKTTNILINDILDEKFARSKELLTEFIGLLFKEANQANQN